MNINKEELVNALAKVKPGLSIKEFIEQSTSFAFKGGKVITYNDELSVSHPIEGLEVEGAIEAEPLYALLSKIDRKVVKLVVRESELIVRAGKVKAGFKLQSEVRLPLEEVNVRKKWRKLINPQTLIKGLKFVAFSTSKDVTKPVLTCVNVLQKGQLQATDNFRATLYEVDELPIGDFLLPVSAIPVLANYEVKFIAETIGWVHFKTEEGTVLSVRIYEDTFPEVKPLMKVKGHALPLPATLDEIIERSLAFTRREVAANSSVEIALTKNEIKVKGKAEIGWFEETDKIVYEGEDVLFIINPLLLIDIVQEPKWEAKISKTGDRMLFKGNNWCHLLMLRLF